MLPEGYPSAFHNALRELERIRKAPAWHRRADNPGEAGKDERNTHPE